MASRHTVSQRHDDDAFLRQCRVIKSNQVGWKLFERQADLKNPVFFTGHFAIPTTLDEASNQNRKFLSRLNRKLFKTKGKWRAGRRPRREITRFPVIEIHHQPDGRRSHHTHMVMDIPQGFSIEDFETAVKQCWNEQSAWNTRNKTRCRFFKESKFIDLQVVSNDSSKKKMGYSLKPRSKDFWEYADYIDAKNVFAPNNS